MIRVIEDYFGLNLSAPLSPTSTLESCHISNWNPISVCLWRYTYSVTKINFVN